ncbi:MAG TPA: M1 family metallopeptidase [Vitreimonas sp.]|uniref:M1 family metallopeptidase n=1 Tax=Vitreimonas sp. TaxID=3069702 RepID=UPI002D35C897|nr:M1 family metallopeptidase [Vitreimonas sp.]HYD89075.1 M1 family metallopeptidase [Vitreimonas sp.]
MQFKPFALIVALLALAPVAGAQTSERQWFAGGPTPLRYEISVTPDVETATFAGEARITVESSEALPAVTMNALGLTVTRATIDGQGVGFDANEEAQTLTLTPRRPLRAGRHTIRIVYSGVIQDDAYGLFRVSYQDDGVTKRALATQFEPGDARRLAPMWDQPNRRAVFALTVTAPSDQMVVGNMPAARTQRLAGGLTRTTFADTPSMPSYLLFLAVGDFERVTRDVDGVELGVVVRRGETHRTAAALEAGEQSLRYFTDYFGIRYPLPKLDMIGVPGAGGFGAMENWGAILYFDQYLLVDETSSEAERQNVFGIVAHEIAHQWFGNLVTMMWWDDLWLNEGFASWMAAKATEAVHPDWNPWMAQLTDGTATAMALDAREGTHPVVQTVNTLDEANLAFDTITYEKGLAVIRMLEAYVGEEDFRQGVRDYLNARQYGNARTEDLWTAIQAASGQPVLEIARSFTGQPGFPLLTANAAACRSGAQVNVTLTQRRFAMDDASRTDERWSIPVVARSVGGEPVRGVMAPAGEHSLALACGPYLVNAGQSGFFRVLYDQRNFGALTQRFASLDEVDQLGLLLDYWAFGRSGDAPFTNYLELVSVLPADADPIIVADTSASMAAFADYAEGRPSEASVKAYGIRTLRPYLERAGWAPRHGEGSNAANTRAGLIATLGALGDEAVIAEARRRVRGGEALPASIRTAVIGVYASNATTADYDALLAQARAATDFVEQRRLWRLLASASDPALARRTLALTLGEEIPRQLRTQVIASVGGAHPRLAWDFLVQNRAAIEAMLDPLQRLEFPTALASLSSDPAMVAELEAYARDFPEGARPTVAAAAAAIRLRAETISERMPAVEAWIAARAPSRRRR